jgi:hypothetical protein
VHDDLLPGERTALAAVRQGPAGRPGHRHRRGLARRRLAKDYATAPTASFLHADDAWGRRAESRPALPPGALTVVRHPTGRRHRPRLPWSGSSQTLIAAGPGPGARRRARAARPLTPDADDEVRANCSASWLTPGDDRDVAGPSTSPRPSPWCPTARRRRGPGAGRTPMLVRSAPQQVRGRHDGPGPGGAARHAAPGQRHPHHARGPGRRAVPPSPGRGARSAIAGRSTSAQPPELRALLLLGNHHLDNAEFARPTTRSSGHGPGEGRGHALGSLRGRGGGCTPSRPDAGPLGRRVAGPRRPREVVPPIYAVPRGRRARRSWLRG